MKKKTKELSNSKKSFKVYWTELKPAIRVCYIISCVLFLSELIYDLFVGSNWEYLKYLFSTLNSGDFKLIDFETIYIFVFPFIYLLLNFIIIKCYKINIITLIILTIVRVTYPTTLELLLTLLLSISFKITGSPWG